MSRRLLWVAAMIVVAGCGGDTTDPAATTNGSETTTTAATTTIAVPAPVLAGSTWIVTDYVLEDGSITNVWPDTEVTIAFGTSGDVSGSTGCNDYGGPFRTEGPYDPTDGQAITLGPLAATEKACAPEHVMEQEAEFLALLDRTGRWVIIRDQLNLRADDGSFLIEAEPSG